MSTTVPGRPPLPGIEVVTVETPGLGDRSYLVTDGSVAVVVDPQRDIDRMERELCARGVRLTHVLETHVHNDYVTGGLALARLRGAEYVVAAAEDVAFARVAVREGDEIATGRLRIRALHTPGHTPHHLAYAAGLEDGGDRLVLTGGSLLHGAVGRTDLVDPTRTDGLTRAQHSSVRRLLSELDGEVEVLPTHGFGSFCSSGPASASSSSSSSGTIADERRSNEVARIADESRFVARVTAGLGDIPRYYRRMAPLNRSGPGPADLSALPDLDPGDMLERIRWGEWVVDVRSRREFAAQHVAGTVNVGLDGAFATYLGWLLPWQAPLTLLGADAEEVAAAQRELVRIGVDRPVGRVVGGPSAVAPEQELRGYEVADFAALAAASEPVVLDVRREDEWREGHLAGAVHVPLPDLDRRVRELPDGPVWVHCGSGYRAAVGASLLARAGRDVVLVDDDLSRAAGAGVCLTAPD